MPKIKDFKYEEYTVRVTYSSDERQFRILLPEELTSYSKTDIIRSETQTGVEDLFKTLVSQFLKDKTKSEKFLIISTQDPKEFHTHDCFSRAGGKTATLDLSWAMVEKTVMDGKPVYHYMRGPEEVVKREFFYTNGNEVFIPWTQERENFLRQTTQAIEEMSRNIYGFMYSKDLSVKMSTIPYRALLQ
jgi:hypothetical protein